MSEIASIKQQSYPSVDTQPQPATARRSADREATVAPPTDDRLELSEAARDSGDELARRIELIRAQIADGTYLTPQKLKVAIDHLCRELLGC